MINFLFLEVISCAFMTGVIWTIQIIHYPSFIFVSENQFQKFHRFHTKNITFVVLPIMLLELSMGVALTILLPDSFLHWLNLLVLLLIWISTFFISVPLHNQLSQEHNIKVIEQLVLTNWVRTFLWSARLSLLFYIMLKTFEVNNGNFVN
jgi:hypothetical protein